MSIIKSTKSGKVGIEITLNHLLKIGWYHPYKSDSKIDPYKICIGPFMKNNPHFLYISHTRNGVTNLVLRLRDIEKTRNQMGVKPEYIYEFQVKTLADLDLVVSFWNENKINRKRKLRNLIMIQSKKESNMWFSFPDSLKAEFQNYVQSDIDNTIDLIKQKMTDELMISKDDFK